jgi:dTDP-4-amino-4,6-dideoxygalactose transaminase
MKVPCLDLRVTDPAERTELLDAVARVLDHGRLVMGPEMDQFEQAIAADVGRRFALAVGSGTHALWLALKALRLSPGDEVITTSLSWIATANAIRLAGGTPVFADVGDDLNLDPASVARLITPRTRAIVPVHYTGRACDMAALGHLAEQHRLAVVEDTAQAYGATFGGRKVGSFGAVAAFSMNPMKVLAACGEAGAVVTDDPALYEQLVALRYNGCVNREMCIEASLNGRMDTLEAAILLKRLPRLPTLIAARRRNAALYDQLLAGVVETPVRTSDREDVFYTYTIRTDRRDELRAYLESQGVETKIQHPYLMPDQPAYQPGVRGEFTHARALQRRFICLPIHEKLTGEQVRYTAACVRAFCRKTKGLAA